ncbi:hypothetical protein TMPK1_31040 [Rhodospirillales bacterium TMPK1]|uniref:PBS lyase n=2 Tax=Roseiterribacter gracilis TaxID=2812848 RepID=A0A8S8XH79_9PROT|nr:hypothetical protein TMPK1_31040 [Rhodospirillales bacterium TMPK1]
MPLIRKDAASSAPAREHADLLRSDDADERWRAARSLATSPAGAAALGAALAGEQDPRVREAIFTSLARLGAVDSVLPHLRSDDANLRTGALDALRAMTDAVRPHLRSLLADPDPDVRLLSCELTRALPAREANSLMIEVIDREAHANVCASAVDVLAELGEATAIASLERCATRFAGQGFLPFAIQVAIERIKAQQEATDG